MARNSNPNNPRSSNTNSRNPMFWRIVRRLLTANYSRLFVILLALGAGAAVTAALLNLQMDAKKRLTTEFRALGANVIVAPKTGSIAVDHLGADSNTIDQAILAKLPQQNDGKRIPIVGFLYLIGSVAKQGTEKFQPAVLAGTEGSGLADVRPGVRTEYSVVEKDASACEVGAKAAAQLQVKAGDTLVLRGRGAEGGPEATCIVFPVVATGGGEDSQIFVPLVLAQMLGGLSGRLSVIQMSVTGTPASIQKFVVELSRNLPEADVHGIKQLTEAEGKLYSRVSGVLSATVLLVLVLTSLCVMAGMSNIAAERKNDVGLMKAIGGSVRRVVELFLAEAVLMGLMGGIVGAAIGILLSISLGKAVFGVAAQPRWIVYPVAVTLTVIVSIASAFPLRRIAGIRPASVFRGEE
jgi:putative ABC transport system permease protein